MMTNTSNHRNPSEFVELINAELASAIQSWRRIANHLLSATEQYGTDSDSYKMILKAANFSKSKACKLVAIARDTRLARQPTLFDTVQAWTTLYEVTTLTDEQFDKLISAAPENGSVTPAFVSAIKKGEIQKAPDAYKVAFNIRIDDAALKSESFTGEHYAKLVSLLKQIQDEILHIRVDNADLFEKNASSEFANLERFMKVARQ
ncbi:hypothetical protein BAL199_17508 [alpha proteobacterium BAL199]|nr:hypothetical protein BAL199_17508 [alpha proteobacterium BAL199]